MTSDLPPAPVRNAESRDMVEELREVRANLRSMRDALELSVLDLQRARSSARRDYDHEPAF